jgi:hypothetical protein
VPTVLSILLAALILAGAVWRPQKLLAGLLLLLLVHEAALRIAQNLLGWPPLWIQIVSLWKDLALAALLVVSVWPAVKTGWTQWRQVRPRAEDLALVAFVLWALISAFVSPNRLAGLAAFRDYVEPMVMLLVVRGLKPEARWLRGLTVAWLAVILVMAMLAVWQSTTWGRADYVRFGFGNPQGLIGIPVEPGSRGASFRPPSTTTGPNEMAVHMLLGLVACGLAFGEAPPKWRWGLVLIGLTALTAMVMSNSRSNFVGFVVAIGVVGGVEVKRRGWFAGRWRERVWVAGALLLVLLGVLALLLVGTGFGRLLVKTITGLQAEYHVRDSLAAVQYLLLHPGGAGMGLAGPRQGFGFPATPAFHVEGSLFQIAVEMGLVGLLIFGVFLILSLRRAWINWGRIEDPQLRLLAGTAVGGWLGSLVSFVFLPLMQALPLMVWLWFLLAIGMQADRLEASWRQPQSPPATSKNLARANL